jgi:hypothetical protein
MLSQMFEPEGIDSEQILTTSDLDLYYGWQHPKWYKHPDWYAVMGVLGFYVIWYNQEENLIIILLDCAKQVGCFQDLNSFIIWIFIVSWACGSHGFRYQSTWHFLIVD